MPTATAEFVEYLEETLIPDLHAAGSDATAEDFETAVRIIRAQQSTIEAGA